MVMHRLNTFHWHLTEDQGWRLEIKKYPKPTEIGAWRKETVIGNPGGIPKDQLRFDGIPHGGFYSQAEVKEVVAYAAARHIRVIPEIEMPGHAQAALAAYPEFGNTGEKIEVWTTWGVSENVFGVQEETFKFLFEVLDEVADLFPSRFIHIGGDECPKTQWRQSPVAQEVIRREGLKDEYELQSWFIRRIEGHLNSLNRRLVGWDEIMEGGLAKTATVMAWRGMEHGVRAAESGNDVVMAPTGWTYLDYYQSRNRDQEPIAIGGFLPLDRVYTFEPIAPEIPEANRRHILGGQGQLWSEYMRDERKVEYMAFPRLCALAETLWSPAEKRNWSDFRRRLKGHLARLDALSVNYRPLDEFEEIPLGGWARMEQDNDWRVREWDLSRIEGLGSGSGRIVFQYREGGHRFDVEWIEIVAGGRVVQRIDQYGITGNFNRGNEYEVVLPADRPLILRARVRGDGGGDSVGSVTFRRRMD
ncbi:MAG: family 20 glycosylhydrolase, partial [Fimbriimonadaceae bacterium]|nr:family 20 glycosylhydrolase [Fimbriimonadaceae bacterium]